MIYLKAVLTAVALTYAILAAVALAMNLTRWLVAGFRNLWRHRMMLAGAEPVEILEFETESKSGEIAAIRVHLLRKWWATDEDYAVAKSQVPLLLKECGFPRTRIVWAPGAAVDPEVRHPVECRRP